MSFLKNGKSHFGTKLFYILVCSTEERVIWYVLTNQTSQKNTATLSPRMTSHHGNYD